MQSDYENYKRYGGVSDKGKIEYVFTDITVNTGWNLWPYAVMGRICRRSYDGSKLMMRPGDKCIILYRDVRGFVVLPTKEWKDNIYNPASLSRLIAGLKRDPAFRR